MICHTVAAKVLWAVGCGAVNLQAEGRVYPAVDVVVDPDRVRSFGLAVLAPEGLGVPPTFATAAEFAAFPAIIADPDLGLDFSRVVHGEQDYEWRRPLVEGESLSATSRIAAIRERRGTGFLTIETELRDADGETVVLARATLIERAG
jgi:acyl dehydratase